MRWRFKDTTEIKDVKDRDIDLPDVVLLLLRNRELTHPKAIEAFFSPDYISGQHDPFLFRQMPIVVDRVREAIKKNEIVGIFGDFDADGVTGSALLRKALEGLGLRAIVHIPDKEKEGHGISSEGIKKFFAQGVTLMFTVDCGIMNMEEVDEADALGIDVIIIDHHHTPEIVPRAIAVINPKMKDSGYPFGGLCGVGTAFKTVQALYHDLAPEKVDQLKWFLDLVAVGTVADCMPIIDENRVFVKYGLVVLAKTRRPGLLKLYEMARLNINEESLPDTTTIGFHIAPRINAAGRMAHAQIAHDLLVAEDTETAQEIASGLETLNRQRQQLSEEISADVRRIAKEQYGDKHFILASDESYSLGIVGLVAGKIADEFQKPTVVLRRGETQSRGSFRSAAGFNIIEAIESCSNLLEKYGGHEQAAGMTIRNENIEEFYAKFNALVAEYRGSTSQSPDLLLDAELSIDEVTFEMARHIGQFEPFGVGNEEPIFAVRNLEVAEMRFVGSGNKHLKMRFVIHEGSSLRFVDGIGFGIGKQFFDLRIGDRVDVAGSLQINRWRGMDFLQIKIVDIKRQGHDSA